MEGTAGRQNDRRASAWALLSYCAARRSGLELRPANVERGVQFILGAYKGTDDKNPSQVGGFSVDSEGLAVVSVTAMGGWVAQRLHRDSAPVNGSIAWIERHPVAWSGPNYYYTEFFRARLLHGADDSGDVYTRHRRKVYLQLRNQQQPDGSFAFPPGNAQNTVAMGPAFSTSMAVLILNVPDSRLVFDLDTRLRPLF